MLWIKSLHVIAVIAWLAGLFYLPRIFVHYAEGLARGEDVRRLVIMARRLFGFMSVMAVFALLFGLWLWLGFHDTGRWLMIKLVFVLGTDRLSRRMPRAAGRLQTRRADAAAAAAAHCSTRRRC